MGMGEDITYDALGHVTAELVAVAALDAQGVQGLVDRRLVQDVLIPTNQLLRATGWRFPRSQQVSSLAVLAQAAHRLRPTASQWASSHVTRYCN